MLAFEHVDLQTQSHDFESKAISRAKEGSQPFKETPCQFEHGDSLHGPVVIRGYLVDRWFLNAMKFWRQTGDGKLDLAVANAGDYSLSIFLGMGRAASPCTR